MQAEQILQGVFDPVADSANGDPSVAEKLSTEVSDLLPVVLLATDRFGTEELRLLSDGKPFNVLVMTGAYALKGATQNPLYTARLALSAADAFVRQTSVADPVGLLDAFREALAYDGSSLLHVYAPDPTRDGIPVDSALELCNTALLAGVFPDIRRLPGSPLDLSRNPGVSADSPTAGDWMYEQERFSELFDFVPRRNWSSEQVSLNEWLELSEADRAISGVYIEKTPASGVKTRYLLAPEVMDFAHACSQAWAVWRSLSEQSGQTLAGLTNVGMDSRPAQPRDDSNDITNANGDANSAASSDSSGGGNANKFSALETLTNKLLALSGFQGSGMSVADRESVAEKDNHDSDEAV
jgi:hypothetical protein